METAQRIDVGGASLWTARRGAGRPLMLANGGPGCCDYLEPVARMVDDLAEVLRFEQRGCGDSSAGGPYDVETCVRDLDVLRQHFGFERWAIGGHSWGADLALCYALAHPERVDALLLICAHGPHDDRGWSAAYREAREARGEREPEYRVAPNPDVNLEGNASYRRAIKRPGLWREIAELAAPTLVVTAGRDIRPSWPLRQLAQLLPSATLVDLPEAEHFAWLSHPEALRSALRGFLQRTLSPSPEP